MELAPKANPLTMFKLVKSDKSPKRKKVMVKPVKPRPATDMPMTAPPENGHVEARVDPLLRGVGRAGVGPWPAFIPKKPASPELESPQDEGDGRGRRQPFGAADAAGDENNRGQRDDENRLNSDTPGAKTPSRLRESSLTAPASASCPHQTGRCGRTNCPQRRAPASR